MSEVQLLTKYSVVSYFKDMPKAKLSEGEYYHIFNRGVDKRQIFSNDVDRWRLSTPLKKI